MRFCFVIIILYFLYFQLFLNVFSFVTFFINDVLRSRDMSMLAAMKIQEQSGKCAWCGASALAP
jgi:hypothetical protein